MKNDINSLADLKREKLRLEARQEITKRQLSNQVEIIRQDVKEFLFYKVALPVGLGIAGIWAVSQFVKYRRSQKPDDEGYELASPDPHAGFAASAHSSYSEDDASSQPTSFSSHHEVPSNHKLNEKQQTNRWLSIFSTALSAYKVYQNAKLNRKVERVADEEQTGLSPRRLAAKYLNQRD